MNTVENLKLKLKDLINVKEDMSAMRESDSSIKEHLIERVNDLEKVNMERSTELLFAKRTMQQLIDEKSLFDSQTEVIQRDLIETKKRYKREIKVLKEHAAKLSEENACLSQAMRSMRNFFE